MRIDRWLLGNETVLEFVICCALVTNSVFFERVTVIILSHKSFHEARQVLLPI